MDHAQNLIWVDLEMSGLNPEHDVILEVACIITTSNLDLVAQSPAWVIHQSNELLAGMSDTVFQLHASSGLLDRVRSSRLSIIQVEQELLKFIKQYTIEGHSPLCGNSIYNDRMFIRKYMPNFNNYLHHRNIDVSTVKELIKRWYPKDPQAEFIKKKLHRALEDINESIAELNHYRKNFFRTN